MEKSILMEKLKDALMECIVDNAKYYSSEVMAVTEPDGVIHENHQYGWSIDDSYPDQIWLIIKGENHLDRPKMLAIFSANDNGIDEIVETAAALIEAKRR